MLQLIELDGNIIFAEPFRLEGVVEFKNTLNLDGNVIIGGGSGTEHPYYDGAYVVTPLAFQETILNTDEKIMRDDVRVLEIPYDETSNIYGTTVIIAS